MSTIDKCKKNIDLNNLDQILFVDQNNEIEDLIVSRYGNGFFLDIGYFNEEKISNTSKLEKIGWSGIHIDKFPDNLERESNCKVSQALFYSENNKEIEFAVINEISEKKSIEDFNERKWERNLNKYIKFKTSLLHVVLNENKAPNFIEYFNLNTKSLESEILGKFPFDKYKFGCISVVNNYDEVRAKSTQEILEKNGYKLEKRFKESDLFVFNEKNTESNKSYKIGLCMIVKNESKIIRRCLDSVKPLIDYVCITDTGSTDNTIQIICDWMKENHIDGKVISEPWKNFSHNRTIALKNIRQVKNIEYALMIDADEVLEYEADFNAEKTKNNLNCDLHNILCKFGNISYIRNSLTRNNMPYLYKGVIHEFLECETQIKTRGTIEGLYNVPIQDSARNETGHKFEDDIEVLNKELKEEKDPFMISRYTFYLAQSYRDSNQPEKAIFFYQKRSEMGFSDQEIYISLYQVAKLKEQLQYPQDDIIQSYLRSHEICPWRIEALHGAIRFCRCNNRSNQAFALAKYALSLEKNTTGLFVENWIWDYGIDDEFTISSYWSNHTKEGMEVAKRLLLNIPENQRERIIRNIDFLQEKL